MSKRTDRRQKLVSDLNITNFIDVILTVLIIFMITAPMMTREVKMKLPKAIHTQPVPRDRSVVVSVNREGSYTVEGAPCEPSALPDVIRLRMKMGSDSLVLISADMNAPYRSILFIYDVLQGIGVSRFAHEIR